MTAPEISSDTPSVSTQVTPRTGLEAVDDMLTAPFAATHHDIRGGIPIDYLTGEQVISRLLDVLGSCGWSFRVLHHDIHAEADEVWVLGELRLLLNGDDPVVRQQFGSSKIKRARTTGAPLDIGFDLKAAATDCLKKCATLVGVGLYLTRKEEDPPDRVPPTAERNGVRQRGQASRSESTRQASRPTGNRVAEPTLACEQCGQNLQPTQTKGGGTWTAAELAAYTRRQHNQMLCADCARSARGATIQASTASANPPS